MTQMQKDMDRVRQTVQMVDEEADPLRRIGLADSLHTSTRWALQTAVESARDQGATWEDVARVLGCSRQAAHQRFGVPRDRVG